MTALRNRSTSARNFSSFGRFMRNAFRMDAAAQRHLENTFVQVHLNSRIWMI
jgi:hypothetical protein